MSDYEEMKNSFSAINEFLGKERLDDLKDFVVEQLKDNLEESIKYRWVVLPTAFGEMWDEMVCDVEKKMIKKYKKVLEEAVSVKVEEFIKTLLDDNAGKKVFE